MQYMDQVDAQGEAIIRVHVDDLVIIANALARFQNLDSQALVPLVEDAVEQIRRDMGE